MGNFFLDGLCRKCEYGFYQDELGQTGCKQCPPGTTTPGRASREAESCSGKIFYIYIFKKILKKREREICMYFMNHLLEFFIRVFYRYNYIYLSVKMILEEGNSKSNSLYAFIVNYLSQYLFSNYIDKN